MTRVVLQRAPLAALVLLAATCGEPKLARLERHGIRIARVTESAPAATVGGVVAVPGDFVIEGDGLRVLVGGLRRAGEAKGAILEATLDGVPADDSVVLVAPRLMVGAEGQAVVAREMYVVERRGRPALRIIGEVLVDGRYVDVHQELMVADAGEAISVSTRVAPRDDEPLEHVRVAARIAWGGARPFVPGVGAIDDELWHDANWIGRSGAEMATVFAYRTPAAHLRAEFEEHGVSRFLSHTNVASHRADIGEDDALVVRSALVLGRPSTAKAVRRLGWIRGAPFPEVLVTLPYAPDGSVIHVRNQEGDPLIDTKPDPDGQALVPLPPVGGERRAEQWIVWATAYGHASSEEVLVEGAPDERVQLEIPRGSRLHVAILDEATGALVPGRVRLRGVGVTPAPALGPDDAASGAVDTVVTAEGDVTIPLPPGTYRVVVTRGPEWTIFQEQVEVTETFRPSVRAVLRHVVDPGDWVGSDFHVHAAPSPDSQVSIEDRIASLLAEGVRFAVPTDHNHVTDYGPSVAALGVTDFGTISGVEVTTWEPAFGHFNAYPWPVDLEAPAQGAPAHQRMRPAQLFSLLKAAGEDVVVQVNHPRMEHDIGYFEVAGLDTRTGSASDWYSADFDAIEVWNGFDLARVDVFERVFEDWLLLLARGKRVVATGNSDSHRVRYQWAGYPRTYVRVPGGRVDDPLAVVRALRAGRAFVTSGPFLEARIGEALPGDTVAVEGGATDVHVTVRAPPWMEVTQLDFYLGPRLIQSAPIAPAPIDGELPVVRFEGVVRLPVPTSTFLVVVARGERSLEMLLGKQGIPPLAFTNPIWLVADRAP